jgi:hypothetical protein
MQVCPDISPKSRTLQAAATRLAEARLLLLRSGATGAEEIASTLAPFVSRIENLQQLQGAGR